MIQDTVVLMIVGIGLAANAVVWGSLLLMRWSRPRPAKWEYFEWKR